MTALNPHRNAYQTARTPRSVEYDLFARVTHQLSRADAARTADFAGFVTAVHDNLRLWSALAADIAHSENALPAPLRAQLFYLYEFTEQHSRKLLSEGAGIAVLVEINMSVMRGLRGEVGV